LNTRTFELTPELILSAYAQGYFPMAEGPNGRIGFYAYEPRGVIPLDHRFTVRRSLRQIIKKDLFEIRFNTRFSDVINTCSREGELPNHEIWLSKEMIKNYQILHQQGYAHSVEVFEREHGRLIGGLYGLTLGRAFFGESMFSRAPYASQLALVALVERLRERNFMLLDAQMSSKHLKQFGLMEYGHEEYMQLLADALEGEAAFG